MSNLETYSVGTSEASLAMTNSKDRFGSFLFGKDGMFAEFSDNQRVDRLKQCASLEHALRQCQQQQQQEQEEERSDMKKNQAATKKSSSWWRFIKQEEAAITEGMNELDTNHKNEKLNQGITATSTSSYEKGDAKKNDSQIIVNNPSNTNDIVAFKIAKFYDWKGRTDDGKNDCEMETHAVWACRAIALGCASELVELKKCFKNANADTNDCKSVQQKLSRCVNQEKLELDHRIQQRRQQTKG